jgi:hypothetical protein
MLVRVRKVSIGLVAVEDGRKAMHGPMQKVEARGGEWMGPFTPELYEALGKLAEHASVLVAVLDRTGGAGWNDRSWGNHAAVNDVRISLSKVYTSSLSEGRT